MQRVHRPQRNLTGHAQSLGRCQPDAHAREAARAVAHGNKVNVGNAQAGLLQAGGHLRHQALGVRYADVQKPGGAQAGVVCHGHAAAGGGGLDGQNSHACGLVSM
jgi:hypothetical protein